MKIYIYLFLSVLPFVFFSCVNTKKSDDGGIADTLLSKTIIFPNSLIQLNGAEFQNINSFTTQNSGKTKIISIIDGACMKCIINQMNKLDSVFSNILIDSDNIMVFVLNVSKQDSTFFMRNLQPSINAKGFILWDNNFNFERENNLFTPDINLRTFMVNPENRIIQYGNPLMHPDVIWEYKAKLENNM